MSTRTPKQKYVTAITTFSAALGIGFVMQYGDAMASRWGEDQPIGGPSSLNAIKDSELPVTPVTAQSISVPESMFLPETEKPEIQVASSAAVPEELETPTFAALDAPTVDALPEPAEQPIVAVAAEAAPMIEMDALPEPVMQEQSCEPALTLTASGFAMVNLSYVAPCAADATVTVLHEEMMFEVVLDANGAFSMDVPVLAEEALFGVEDANGNTSFAITGVPEIAMYDRVVLQWQGAENLQLHALEFGASYGEEGHVWSAATGDRVNAASGTGGFLTRLGEASTETGYFADVYTFPTGLNALDGQVALSVEAEVTDLNCGQKVKAQTMQVLPNTRPDTNNLTMFMPSCDAIGEFLVLNNLFEDLTLASR